MLLFIDFVLYIYRIGHFYILFIYFSFINGF